MSAGLEKLKRARRAFTLRRVSSAAMLGVCLVQGCVAGCAGAVALLQLSGATLLLAGAQPRR